MASENGAADNSKTNLIVNYLPQTLTDEEFRSMFLSIGPIRACKIIRDRATGYSYGFGFVDYVNETDAERAISTLNGLSLQNKTIKVAYARHGEDIKGANLYIRNLPRAMNEDDLRNLFSEYGDIVQCRILKDTHTHLSKGVGFVLFDKKVQADVAIKELHGKVPPGGNEQLNIKFAEDNRGKARPPVVVVANRGPYGPPGGYGGYGGPPGPMRNQGPGGRYRYHPMGGNSYGNYGNYGGGMGGGGMGVGGGGGDNEGGHVLFVYNIGPDADESSLWNMFNPFGTVQKVNVIRDQARDKCKGYGFVTMTNYHEATAAIDALNGYRYMGRNLQVSFKTQK